MRKEIFIMKNKLIYSTLLGTVLFTGCSFSNPFGVGYEHSACEISGGFGVCGAPKKIYYYRDKIKQVQQDYMASGYEDEVFFGINNSGDILVKSEREDNWQLYKGSYIEKEIQSLIKDKENQQKQLTKINSPVMKKELNLGQDIPVTKGNDLSVSYKNQKPLIQTRTNVGPIVRDTGLVQKIWIAPVVDKNKDLVSAHEIYVVVKEASWVVGERTPKAITRNNVGNIPTPISKSLLGQVQKYKDHEEKVVNSYNNDSYSGLYKEIKNPPKVNKDIELINQYIGDSK